MTAKLKYLSLFVWIGGAAAVYGLYLSYGTPHIIWSYTFQDNGDPFNPYAGRFYTSCSFYGSTGLHKVPAQNGRCGWVRFFKEDA